MSSTVASDVDPEFDARLQLWCANDAMRRKFFTSETRLLPPLSGAFLRFAEAFLIFHPGEEISAKNLRRLVQVTSTITFGLLDPEIKPD